MSCDIQGIEEFGNYEHIKWNEEFKKIVSKGKLLADGFFEIDPTDVANMLGYMKINYEMAPEAYRNECINCAKESAERMSAHGIILPEQESSQRLIGILARAEFNRRNRWNNYMLGQCDMKDGRCVMPAEKYDRWTRQMNTAYEDLSEDEKQSDRDEFIVLFELIENYKRELEKE